MFVPGKRSLKNLQQPQKEEIDRCVKKFIYLYGAKALTYFYTESVALFSDSELRNFFINKRISKLLLRPHFRAWAVAYLLLKVS